MIYHSIVLPQIIFDVNADVPLEAANHSFSGFLEKAEVQFNGYSLVGYMNENDQLLVERVISTNPKVYLDSRLKPGQMVTIDRNLKRK